jgi:hypothetical protein
MKLLTGLTDSPAQRARIMLDDGSMAVIALRYTSMQLGWFFDIAYAPGNFELAGARLVTSPNILRQWRNLIPFGLAVACREGGEPTRREFLTDGTVSLYLLEGGDIAEVEAAYFTK